MITFTLHKKVADVDTDIYEKIKEHFWQFHKSHSQLEFTSNMMVIQRS